MGLVMLSAPAACAFAIGCIEWLPEAFVYACKLEALKQAASSPHNMADHALRHFFL
jgi:hypothetical protein